MIALLTVDIATATAATDVNRYVSMPDAGRWRVVGAKFAPAVALAAGDGTNRADITLATNDGAGGAFTVLATLTGNANAYAIGTTRSFTLATPIEVASGQQLRISKDAVGTGGVLEGAVSLILEKIA